jgi:uncharacterized membrane protein
MTTPQHLVAESAQLSLGAPLRWLRLGAQDFARNPRPGLMHGGVLMVFGWLLWFVAADQFWLLSGAFTGFLIVAPVLASGLYEVSRQAAQGRVVCCAEVLRIWRSRDPRMVRFGLLLGLAGTGWVLTSASLITLWSATPVHKPSDFLQHVVLAPSPGLFEVWLLIGAMLAAPVFASSVITLPMLIDSRVAMWDAVGESWRVVGSSPVVMALWAFCIALLFGASIATLLFGLLFVVPVVGHASWHAYAEVKRLAVIQVPVQEG